jgi:hypothetical protein
MNNKGGYVEGNLEEGTRYGFPGRIKDNIADNQAPSKLSREYFRQPGRIRE